MGTRLFAGRGLGSSQSVIIILRTFLDEGMTFFYLGLSYTVHTIYRQMIFVETYNLKRCHHPRMVCLFMK